MLETGLKLLPITSRIEFPGGMGQFFRGDVPALLGSELESRPVRLILGCLIEVIEVIMAPRCSDEQSPALLVG